MEEELLRLYVSDLRKELRIKQLPTEGKKPDLVKRILTAYNYDAVKAKEIFNKYKPTSKIYVDKSKTQETQKETEHSSDSLVQEASNPSTTTTNETKVIILDDSDDDDLDETMVPIKVEKIPEHELHSEIATKENLQQEKIQQNPQQEKRFLKRKIRKASDDVMEEEEMEEQEEDSSLSSGNTQGMKLVNGVWVPKRPVGRPLGSTKKQKLLKQKTQPNTQQQQFSTPQKLSTPIKTVVAASPLSLVSPQPSVSTHQKRTGEINMNNLQRYNIFGEEDILFYNQVLMEQFHNLLG